jgi:hypothetical protein
LKIPLPAPAQPEKLSLYERLGGIYSIACVVDDFIDRIMAHRASDIRWGWKVFEAPGVEPIFLQRLSRST